MFWNNAKKYRCVPRVRPKKNIGNAHKTRPNNDDPMYHPSFMPPPGCRLWVAMVAEGGSGVEGQGSEGGGNYGMNKKIGNILKKL